MIIRVLMLLAAAFSAPADAPSIMELRPRGAERGRPFTLTVIGRDIPDAARIWSTMPATFTRIASQSPEPMMSAGRAVRFLVEPTGNLAPGVYPVRLETEAGISNILLFSIGAFPELTEQESLPYSEPNRNDTIENAETVQTGPVTINGTLRGAERDIFRISAKAGEARVFEVESRRCGSAIDPVLRILDGAGNQLARSDDAPGIHLDPRLEFKFPREGFYYVEVTDSRFSTQVQNFYRLKMGAYPWADGVFPFGGQRGKSTEVTFFGGNLSTPVKAVVDLRSTPEGTEFATATLPESPALPFLFPVSEHPEVIEPAGPVTAPVVINGKLERTAETDTYKLQVEPGDRLLIEVQARDLGLSKIEAILTVFDAEGRKLDSAGDKPLPEDVFAVQGTSRTSSDPFLNITVPPGSRELRLSIEDLARRGGPNYGYRIAVRKQDQDFRLTLATPHINIPRGGTGIVTAIADRRGYDGHIDLAIENLPKGIRVEGGGIPPEVVDAKGARAMSRRGVLVLSADPDTEMPARQLSVIGTGKTADGRVLSRRARGPAMAIEVAGATAQGVVDRQRALTAPWLGLALPVAGTLPQIAELSIRQVNFTRMDEGDKFDFAWEWKVRTPDAQLPRDLSVDVVGIRDIRIVAFEKKGDGGTFSINTTKATDPGRYDLIVRGRVQTATGSEDIYARPLPLIVTERRSDVQTASGQ